MPDDARDAISFIDASPSPYHAVAEASRRLDAAGFAERRETDDWSGAGAPGYLRRGGSLVAWIPGGDPAAGFRIVGAHTDSPNLRIKPRPELDSAGWQQLAVEVYGGALINSWLDRELGLSGRVGVTGPDGRPELRLFHDDRPLLRIPQLAIHLDREVNQNGLKLDPQRHLDPVWGVGRGSTGSFAAYLASQVAVDETAVLSWEVMTHDVSPGTLAGMHDELLSCGRIDDLLSCWAAISAIASPGPTSPAATTVVALFDHEEVGSVTASGAASDLLATTLERIQLAAGGDRRAWLAAISASVCLSVDGAHATHPNYAERHDPLHPVVVNGGPVLKHNANARYATDAETAAWFQLACREAGVPLQHFVSRNDMPCGSTIGPLTAGRLGIPTVDVGVAQLAMHSAREVCGSADPPLLVRAIRAFVAPAGPG